MLHARHRKDIVSISLAFVFLASSLIFCAASWGYTPPVKMSPPSQEFLDWSTGGAGRRLLRHTERGYPLGLIPRPIDLSHTRGRSIFQSLQAVKLPQYYDLREHNKLTPVRDQGACGSCWAFASYGSLESWLMPTENRDFSENNLINLSGFDLGPCDGGLDLMALAYLARWSGPINESDDPYDFTPSPTGLTVRKHVQEALFIPDRTGPTDNNDLKQAVMTYGAVYTSMYYDDPYFKEATDAYYFDGNDTSNHAVCIVGWDDTYDRGRFPSSPPANGAFIIKNSWGASWGENGYFYVSYYDSNIGMTNTAFEDAEPTSNYKRAYQYDPLGWTASLGYSDYTAMFANVFRASSTEVLTAVSFYSASPSSTYDISVYLNPTSGPVTSGSPVTTQSGTVGFGYFTIPLGSPVALTSGQRFSVVVKLTTPGYRYPIPAEYPVPNYSSAAVAASGEGYVSADGGMWEDVTDYFINTSVCLKAFTSETRKVATPSFSPDGGTYSSAQNVTITCSTSGAEIRYTSEGTDPTTSSVLYTGPVPVGSSLTLKAKAWKSDYAPSDIGRADYVIGSHPPYDVSLSPTSGWIVVDRQLRFTSVYGDNGGYASIRGGYLLINASLSTSRALNLKYERAENKLYVRNDSDTAWLGGYAPGSSRTIENSYCKLYCQNSYISASGNRLTANGNRLTVNWSVVLKSRLSGNSCKAWMRVYDDRGQQAGWDQMGSFNLARPPRNVIITPSAGTFSVARETTFSSTWSDPNGAGNISLCYLTISPSRSAPLMAYLFYNAGTDLLYLWDPKTMNWYGGYHPKSQHSIDNSYCRLHCENTSIVKYGTNLTVKWRIEFKTPMSGKTCGQWMLVYDAQSLSDGPDKMGSILVR